MRILVHDFGGYPFAAELSRELARRGHDVTHAWCTSLVDTPASARAFGDEVPDGLSLAPLDLGEPLDKYRYLKRFRQERRYGRLGVGLIDRVRPDVVMCANMPLDAQRSQLEASRRLGIPFVFWLQDLIGPATENLLRSRLPVIGFVLGRHYTGLEGRLLRASSAVVPITDDFFPYLARSRVERGRITTVRNWAPLGSLPLRPKRSAFALREGLADRFVFAYTGAIGMKQDPDLLIALASHYRERDDVRVVVHSGGPALDYLQARGRERGLTNLVVRGFVPWNELADVLGAADVTLASIHREAGRYSVPSKVMAYLCAGRPVVLSVSRDNLAARIVAREDAGVVVEPGDTAGFLAAADLLLGSQEQRARMGRNARRYAEAAFAIGPIADRFESVLSRAVDGSAGRVA